MLALATTGWLTEIDENALEDQKWFLFSENIEKILSFRLEPLLICGRTTGPKGREGRQLQAKQRYLELYVNSGTSL